MKNEQGNTIIITMMMIATFAGLISVSFDFTTSMDKSSARAQAYQAATNIADGLLDQAFTVWKNASQNRGVVGELTTADLKNTLANYTVISASVGASASGFYYTQDLTTGSDGFKKDFKITHIDGFGNDVTATSVTSNPKAMEDYLRPTVGIGTNYRNFYYKAHVGVSVPIRGRTGEAVRVESNRYFVKRFKSPWNFAIFFNDNLEINPGPDMRINGWVHSNGNIYTANNSVRMLGRVSFGDGFEGNFGPGDNRRVATTGNNVFPTNVDIYNGGTDLVSGATVANGYLDNWTSSSPPTSGSKQQVIDIPNDSFDTSATGTYGNNDDGYQEIIQPANTSYPDRPEIAKQRFANKADMYVEVYNNSSGVATVRYKTKQGSADANGMSTYSGWYSWDTSGTAPNIFRPGQIVRDNREGGNVEVMDLDVSIVRQYQSLGYLPSGAVIYFNDTRATSTANKGLRLIRGASLPGGGLTVASANPVYVLGDYNTNGTYASVTATVPTTQPVSNSTTPDQTKSTITGTVQLPAAIIGDAITVLSNRWSDATINNNGNSVTSASRTTINAAFMMGNVPTSGTAGSPGTYSGGAENFPRFLEDWTNVDFTYWGSMVQMFQSQQATERWGKGNVYSAPLRRWNFDSRLINNPPPGTPYLVSYSKTDGRWFLQ